MNGFSVGETVLIPCDVGTGPFPNEKLVTISQDGKVLSGFVSAEFIESHGDKSFVRAEIINTENDSIWLGIPGSFFTAAHGRAPFPANWAAKNLQRVAA